MRFGWFGKAVIFVIGFVLVTQVLIPVVFGADPLSSEALHTWIILIVFKSGIDELVDAIAKGGPR